MQSAEAQKDALKIDPMFEEDDAPSGKLDDAEIARLVSLSTQAAYHRTDLLEQRRSMMEAWAHYVCGMDADDGKVVHLSKKS